MNNDKPLQFDIDEPVDMGRKKWTQTFGYRKVVLAFLVMSIVCDYMLRVNFNVAIVSMVAPQRGDLNVSAVIGVVGSCPFPLSIVTNETHASEITTDKPRAEQFHWSQTEQGNILGAFYYGYIILQIPSGRFAEIFGGKWLIAFGIAASGLINILTPLLARSVALIWFSRLFLGISQAVIFPACFAMICKWLPKEERAFGNSVVNAGGNVGSVLASVFTGMLAQYGFSGGWPSVFYVFGTVGIVFTFAYMVFVKPAPTCHNNNSILSASANNNNNINEFEQENKTINKRKTKQHRVPWLAIFTSPPVLANGAARFAGGFGVFLLQTKLPAYLQDVLHISLTTNGFVNGAIYLAPVISMMLSGWFSERVIAYGLSRTTTRRIFTGFALTGCGLCMALMPHTGCDHTLVMAILFIGMFSYGFVAGGDMVTPAEMTKKYPATIFAYVNMICMMSGFIAPFLVGVLLEGVTTGEELRHQWDIVFYMTSAVLLTGAALFATFGSADVQKFDELYSDGDEKNEYCLTDSQEQLNTIQK